MPEQEKKISAAKEQLEFLGALSGELEDVTDVSSPAFISAIIVVVALALAFLILLCALLLSHPFACSQLTTLLLSQGESAMHRACGDGNVEVVSLLLTANATPDKHSSPEASLH